MFRSVCEQTVSTQLESEGTRRITAAVLLVACSIARACRIDDCWFCGHRVQLQLEKAAKQ